MQDLPWKPHLTRLVENMSEIKQELLKGGPFLIYFYRPSCPYCVMGQPKLDAAVSKLPEKFRHSVLRYNTEMKREESRKLFKDLTKEEMIGVPSIIAISSQDRVGIYTGPREAQDLQRLFEGLDKT